MFAMGGSHLELGDHILSREYFPAAPLAMTDELKAAMIDYYDFMTAYQNLLREKSSKFDFSVFATAGQGVNVCSWPPKENSVVTFSKNVGTATVVNFLNFLDTDDLSWRDADGTRRVPPLKENLPVSVDMSRKVNRVWVASPDALGGAPREISFEQNDGKVTFTLPSLKYWTMAVFETDKVEDELLIVGDATETGWDTDKAVRMDSNDGGSVFSATVRLEAGKEFKFVNGTDYGTCLHYNAEYEDFNFNEQYNISTASLVMNTDADFSRGSADYKFTVAETAFYRIVVDLADMKISVGKADGSSGVENVTADKPKGGDSFFTVEGMKVSRPSSPGLYVHDGRKIMVK